MKFPPIARATRRQLTERSWTGEHFDSATVARLTSTARCRALRARLTGSQTAVLGLGQVEHALFGTPAIVLLQHRKPFGTTQDVARPRQVPALFQAFIKRHRSLKNRPEKCQARTLARAKSAGRQSALPSCPPKLVCRCYSVPDPDASEPSAAGRLSSRRAAWSQMKNASTPPTSDPKL
jgi:hypothetical protein